MQPHFYPVFRSSESSRCVSVLQFSRLLETRLSFILIASPFPLLKSLPQQSRVEGQNWTCLPCLHIALCGWLAHLCFLSTTSQVTNYIDDHLLGLKFIYWLIIVFLLTDHNFPFKPLFLINFRTLWTLSRTFESLWLMESLPSHPFRMEWCHLCPLSSHFSTELIPNEERSKNNHCLLWICPVWFNLYVGL